MKSNTAEHLSFGTTLSHPGINDICKNLNFNVYFAAEWYFKQKHSQPSMSLKFAQCQKCISTRLLSSKFNCSTTTLFLSFAASSFSHINFLYINELTISLKCNLSNNEVFLQIYTFLFFGRGRYKNGTLPQNFPNKWFRW